MARYLICITGASGAVYGLRLLTALAAAGTTVHLICSPWGARVVLEETGLPIGYWLGKIRSGGGPGAEPTTVTVHRCDDFSAPVASGSFRLDGMAVIPCSMGTIGALASGVSANLVQRSGAVALKEGWPLVLVPRETPLSLVALRNLVSLKESGAVILPASPGFYGKPSTIESLVDQVVHRTMDCLGANARGAFRWREDKGPTGAF
jgi:4-hydroxy-3-polyprenylbenzoate decarboxylase